MNTSLFRLAEGIVSPAYIRQGESSRKSRERQIKALLAQRCVPRAAWDERTLSLFLAEIASMDTNNFCDNVGVGEREGRVFSGAVRQRHFGLAHGIGRSGDIGAIQPKAAGSSLLMKLATAMSLHTIKLSGCQNVKACLLLPVATGMAIVLSLMCLRLRCLAEKKNPKYVIWPRIDQKTCLKAISNSGFTPIVIENKRDGDMLRTDLAAIESAIDRVGADSVLCVLSTSSCFAPRVPDRVEDIAALCKARGVAHVINNAYGLQSSRSMGRIATAASKGRVDLFVQSTDKNLMVPVGGSIVAGFDKKLIEQVSKTYPGRASMSPVLDVFVTLVSMGQPGYLGLLRQRAQVFEYLKKRLSEVASACGERVLATRHNPISLAMTIDSMSVGAEGASYVGSLLFHRCVSGPRTVVRGTRKSVCGIEFVGYGSHCNAYPHDYIVVAGAIGMSQADVDGFVLRLNKAIKLVRKEQAKLKASAEKRAGDAKVFSGPEGATPNRGKLAVEGKAAPAASGEEKQEQNQEAKRAVSGPRAPSRK